MTQQAYGQTQYVKQVLFKHHPFVVAGVSIICKQRPIVSIVFKTASEYACAAKASDMYDLISGYAVVAARVLTNESLQRRAKFEQDERTP